MPLSEPELEVFYYEKNIHHSDFDSVPPKGVLETKIYNLDPDLDSRKPGSMNHSRTTS